MTTSVKSPFCGAVMAALLFTCGPMGPGGCALFGASGQQSQPSQPDLSLSLQPVQSVVQAGSPVKVAFTTTNLTDRIVQYSCWILIPCGLEVHDQRGNQPPDTKLHRRFRVVPEHSPNVAVEETLAGTLGLGVLKPAETKTHDIDVDGWYDFSQPGTYTMQVVRTTVGGQIWLKSNSVTVTVEPAPSPTPTSGTSGTSASQPPFSITIIMDSKPGFPAGLTIRTKNISDHRILLRTEEASKEHAGSIYKLDVRDSTGAPPPDTDFGQLTRNRDLSPLTSLPPGTPRGGGLSLSLKPGETWADCVMLRTVFTLNKAGQYTIQVRRWDDETNTWVASNVVTVAVDQYGAVRSATSP